MLETFLEIITTRLLKTKNELSSLTALFKNLASKYWPQYLGNHTDNTDGTYTYLSNYTNSNRYFAVLIHYVCIYYK